MKWARGEGVFIGPESSGCLVLRAYIRYYYTAVQTMFRTTRYYLVDSVKVPHMSVVLFTEYDCTIC